MSDRKMMYWGQDVETLTREELIDALRCVMEQRDSIKEAASSALQLYCAAAAGVERQS